MAGAGRHRYRNWGLLRSAARSRRTLRHAVQPWVMPRWPPRWTAIAIAACIIPARRAAHLDVMRILNAL